MNGRGFFHSTAALITALGTLMAALVALGMFLLGDGILAQSGQGDAAEPGRGPKQDNTVQLTGTFGRFGTSGFEFDGSEIKRNPESSSGADIVVYEALDKLSVYEGRIIAWEKEGSPTRDDCAKLLETHGAPGEYKIENDARFCIRSSRGRTAFLAVVNDGKEYDVYVWK